MDNEEVKVLASSEPFEGRHASGWFFLALGCAALGIVSLANLFDPESTAAAVFMFTGAVAFLAVIVLYTLDYKATVKHMAEILNMKFKLTPNATLDEVYKKIEPALKNIHGDKVKIARESDCVTVTYEGITYKILLGDATFSVRWQKSFLDKALTVFAVIVDKEHDAEPTWKYNKIRTATPMIACELQRAFGVTENFSPAQTIEEIYRKKKLAAANAAQQKISVPPKKIDAPNFFAKHKKKFLIAAVVFAGLILITATFGNSTPKTLDQFIEQYNSEIKRTAKDSTLDNLAAECTLDKNNFQWNDAGKTQTFFYDSIYFSGWDSSVDRMSDNPGGAPVFAQFIFYHDPPASAVFAVIRAAISAAGDDDETVAKGMA